MARTQLASAPVVFYAGLFVCIDIAYNVFESRILSGTDASQVPTRMRRAARSRSLVVLAGFTLSTLDAIVAPRVAFGLICGSLMLHLRPEVAAKRS